MRGIPAATAREYIKRYPHLSSKALARLLVAREPKLFADVEAARFAVRGARGAVGKIRRVVVQRRSPEEVRRCRESGVGLPVTLATPWEQARLPAGCSRGLILADLHVPYHSDTALRAALRHGREYKPDFVLILGDLMDCLSVSHFMVDPRERDYAGELQAGREVLAVLRKLFPRARILYYEGNHERRLKYYIWQHAEVLADVDGATLPEQLRLSEYGVDWIEDSRGIAVGRLLLLHGHELACGTAAPVSPARTAFLRTGECCLLGHYHKTSEHAVTTSADRLVSAWSIGCLCDLHPAMGGRRVYGWNWGFAELTVRGHSDFLVRNRRILRTGEIV